MPAGTPDPTKLRPLTPSGWSALRSLAMGPRPRQEFNSGVNQRLEREGLTEVFLADTPYGKKQLSQKIQWVRITDAGREKLKERP